MCMSNRLPTTTPKRRWLQFSIRTVLLLVSVLCVALTVLVVPLEQRRRAVEAIEALGGRVTYVDSQTTDESFPRGLLRRWLPQAYVDEVAIVGFSNTQITDAGLAPLEGLTGLRELYLDNTQITDAGLAHLKGLAGLQTLLLHDTQITDAGLTHLKGLTALRVICIENTQITDAGLAHLEDLPGLQKPAISFAR